MPEMANGHAKPETGNGLTKPEMANGHAKPETGNGLTKPEMANGHAKPETGNGLTKPEMTNGHAKPDLHAVIIPYPTQGHVTPSLQLAKKLVALHGFRVTFVNTIHVHALFTKLNGSTADYNGIEFVTVWDGLPDDHPRLLDLTAFDIAMANMGPAFEGLFAYLLKKSAITCVIRDLMFFCVHPVVKKLDIPQAVFLTASAIAEHLKYNLDTFISAGVLPLPPPPDASTVSMNAATGTVGPPRSDAEAAVRKSLVTCVPGVSSTMLVEEIPYFLLSFSLDSFFIRLYLDFQNPPVPGSDCVLVNTFSELEGDVLNAMEVSMSKNIFAVGPLALQSATTKNEVALAAVGSALWEEDPVSISWLDKQEPSSVLYISFGSITTASMEQVREFAVGLEASNVPFLWVIRPNLIAELSGANNDFETMFAGFVERTRDRALLVPWVSQTAVLSHPAVGAFLTHCGWNSIIESVSAGVPLLGWPRFSDQKTNMHYITSVWKIGLELELNGVAEDGTPLVVSEEVAAKAKRIMGVEEHEAAVQIRSRCGSLKMAARRAVSTGGSSQEALAKFVGFVAGLAESKAPPHS